MCRAYIGLNETSNSLNFDSAKDILDLRLKKISKRNDASDYVFGVGLDKLKSPIPDDIETIIQLIEDHCMFVTLSVRNNNNNKKQLIYLFIYLELYMI